MSPTAGLRLLLLFAGDEASEDEEADDDLLLLLGPGEPGGDDAIAKVVEAEGAVPALTLSKNETSALLELLGKIPPWVRWPCHVRYEFHLPPIPLSVSLMGRESPPYFTMTGNVPFSNAALMAAEGADS
jgi:hypothetical protein